MARKKEEEGIEIGNYFVKEKKYIFIPSGCTILDCVLGGGYPIGRISNIIGDASTNKTGLSIEAIANFRKTFSDGYIWYQDAEAAFDVDYAETIGLPSDDRTYVIDDTRDIEKTYNLMCKAVEMAMEEKVNGLYVIDTLDGLIPEAEGLSAGYDAAQRAKLINSMITKIASKVKDSNIHLMIISQIRDNVGVVGYGPKHIVSGGKALQFFSSQRLWLKELAKMKKTIRGIEKVYGIEVEASCKKNKVGFPFRKCEFPVIFNYGIDDIFACLDWLKDVKGGLEQFGIEKKDIKSFASGADIDTKNKIRETTIKMWLEVENEFLPKESKY